MGTGLRVLIAGESWITVSTHIKGFDHFVTSSYAEGVRWLREGLASNGIAVDYLPNHVANVEFPDTIEALRAYDVVMLSDIGTNTLLLHPDTFGASVARPNRLKLLEQYVENGGGLAMIGGYMTFQGIDGKGRWHDTPVERVLPVNISPVDDRVEVPEGVHPVVVQAGHPILDGIPSEWPFFLGYNRTTLKPGATLLAEVNGDPFIAVQRAGEGRTAIFASDCSPHWGPPAFVNWPSYGRFWTQLVRWLAGRE